MKNQKYTLLLDESGYGHCLIVFCKNEEQKNKIKELYECNFLSWVRSLEIIEGYNTNLIGEKIRASLFLKQLNLTN